MENIFKKIYAQNFKEIEIICIFNQENMFIQNFIESYMDDEIPIQILFKWDSVNLFEYISGEYVLILDSNNWVSTLKLYEIYNTSSNFNLDILLFNLDFYYENINNCIKTNFEGNIDFNKLFEVPKFIYNVYNINFLKKHNIHIPIDNTSFDYLSFYFISFFSAQHIISSHLLKFSKRIFIDHNFNEGILTNFHDMTIFDENNYVFELNNQSFFDNIHNIINFFNNNGLYIEYKYELLNYLFSLFYNIYNLKIINDVDYFVFLKDIITKFYFNFHNDLVLVLKPNYMKFYNNILKSNCMSELNLRYEYYDLVIKNEKLQLKYDELGYNVNSFLTGRLDIKNYGNKNNSVEVIGISDKQASKSYPYWFKDNHGSGLVIQSSSGCIDLKIKCVNDGNLTFKLRGVDLKSPQGIRIPIFIDFNKFMINEDVIIDEHQVVYHDNPFEYSKPVKNEDEYHIHIEWSSINQWSNFNYRVYSEEMFDDKLKNIDDLLSARVDVLNRGNENNFVEVIDISDNQAHKYYPNWFKKDYGSGLVISSSKGVLDLKLKCINDGNLEISLRGIDFRGQNRERIPIPITFSKLIVDDEIIFNENNLVWHDVAFKYFKSVKNNDVISIHIEWIPLNNIIKSLLK